MTMELATRDGVWISYDREEFLEALGDFDPDYDAVGFAVRNLGFVKVNFRSLLAMNIEFHPRNTSPKAVNATTERIANGPATLFEIRHLDDNGKWQSEVFSFREEAYLRIEELYAPYFRTVTQGNKPDFLQQGWRPWKLSP